VSRTIGRGGIGAADGIGVHQRTEGEPDFQEARVPSRAELEGLLDKIIARLIKVLTRLGYLVEEQGASYIADIVADTRSAVAWAAGGASACAAGTTRLRRRSTGTIQRTPDFASA
jgi:hypothetical protein